MARHGCGRQQFSLKFYWVRNSCSADVSGHLKIFFYFIKTLLIGRDQPANYRLHIATTGDSTLKRVGGRGSHCLLLSDLPSVHHPFVYTPHSLSSLGVGVGKEREHGGSGRGLERFFLQTGFMLG